MEARSSDTVDPPYYTDGRDQVIITQPMPPSNRSLPWTPEEERLVDCLNSVMVITICPCMSLCMPVICPTDYERAVLFRLGRLRSGGARGPGVTFINPILDEHVTVDMRVIAMDVQPQEVMTADAVTILVDAVVFYRVKDAVASVCNVYDFREATLHMGESAIRNVLAKYTLSELLERKSQMVENLERVLEQSTSAWGIQVVNLELKNVLLPTEMIRSMGTEAETAKYALAKVELSRGEELASKNLAKAAECLENPSAVTLRSLDTMLKIAQQSKSTALVPVPIPEGFWVWK